MSNDSLSHAAKNIARELRFPKNVPKTSASRSEGRLNRLGKDERDWEGVSGSSGVEVSEGEGVERVREGDREAAAVEVERGGEGDIVAAMLGEDEKLNDRASSDFLLRMNVKASVKPVQPLSVPNVEVGIFEEDEVEMDSSALQTMVKEIEGTVSKYFKAGPDDRYVSVHEVVLKCIRSSAKIYGEKEAKKWAEGFT